MQKDASVVVDFLANAIPSLEREGFDAQCLVDAMSPDGENKLPALVSFLRSQNCSFGDPARRNVAAAAVQTHTDGGDKQTECSYDEADNHNGEASRGAASTSTKTAVQKQKSKKKPKKAKGRGRK